MAPTQPTDTLPLPARIFHAAMQRQSSLDTYAAALEVPSDALRALLVAQADQLDPELISRIAAAHGHKADGAALAQPLAAEPFSAWLGRNMEGVSQTSLRARAKLEAPQLRAFLSGKALPDADQAERIARALYIDGAEMARVIVADMARRAERPPAEPAPAGPDAPTPARTRGRRQSQDGADAPPTPGEVAQAEPSPEVAGVPSGRRRRSRAAAPTVEAIPAQAELSLGEAEAAEATPQRGRRRREHAAAAPIEEAAPETASPLPTAEATPTQTEASPGEADAAEAAPRRGRRRREHAAIPTAETAPAQAEPSPAEAEAPSGRRRRSRAAVPPAETAPETVSPLPAAEAAPTQTEPSSAETEAAEAAPRRGRRRREHAAAAPIEEAVPPDAGSPPSEATADMAPAPDRRSSEQGATAPTVAATVNPGETTLQLSPDEVRLIRIWRRLHPHGRRATMQYIGSLLVEE